MVISITALVFSTTGSAFAAKTLIDGSDGESTPPAPAPTSAGPPSSPPTATTRSIYVKVQAGNTGGSNGSNGSTSHVRNVTIEATGAEATFANYVFGS